MLRFQQLHPFVASCSATLWLLTLGQLPASTAEAWAPRAAGPLWVCLPCTSPPVENLSWGTVLPLPVLNVSGNYLSQSLSLWATKWDFLSRTLPIEVKGRVYLLVVKLGRSRGEACESRWQPQLHASWKPPACGSAKLIA